MLANFATFIQVLVALFISMCFEDVFDFWNPRFDEKYALLKIEVGEDVTKQEFLKEFSEIVKNFVNEYKHSFFKRGAIMTAFTSILLLFTGLETYLPVKEGDPAYQSFAISSVVLFCYIAICLNKVILFKKHGLLPPRKFSLIVIGYFLVLFTFISIYFWGDVVREFIDTNKITIITLILLLFALHMIYFHDRFKVEDVKPVTLSEKLSPYLMMLFHYAGSIFFTILPIIYSNEIFYICREYSIAVTLGVCIFEFLWAAVLSWHYGRQYPKHLERVLTDALVLVNENKDKLSDEELNSLLYSKLKPKLSRDPSYCKFYLINLDMTERYFNLFVSKVKKRIDKWKKK